MEVVIAFAINVVIVVFAAGVNYQSVRTMKADVAAIRGKLYNGMSESLVRLEQKVDDLPCMSGVKCDA